MTANYMTVDADSFRSFELQQSLFDIRINDVPIWERIRFKIWREIKQQHGTGQAHTSVDKTLQDYVTGGLLFAKNLVHRNPFFAEESDIAFFGHQRRKKEADGFWWDIYCDPIHNECEYEHVHFESDYLLNHLTPAKTEDLRYLDLITYGNTIQKLLGINDVSIPESDRHHLRELEAEFSREFNADIDLVARVEQKLAHRKRTLPLYRRLLNKVSPNLVVVVVGYGSENLIEACGELDIPVTELQHGVIYEDHFGYSYPGSRTKETFPDYLLVWGEFWKDAIETPLSDDRVIPVGYPYLEQTKQQYENVEPDNQILFISQGTIGAELSQFALEVAQHPDIDYEVRYKLHPGEYDRWESEYPWLVNAEAPITIIDGSEPPLYELFAESNVQIGVGSTAVYEGLLFGLETYVYDCEGSTVLQPLIYEGSAELISTTDELVDSLGSGASAFNKEYYFEQHATQTMCQVLSRLEAEGTTYYNK